MLIGTVKEGDDAVGGADRVMRGLVQRHGPCTLRKGRGDHFAALVESIVYQQLAGKAAAAIHARFVGQFDAGLTPEHVSAAPDGVFTRAGLSRAKTASIRDLAAKVADGTVPLRGIGRLKDEDVIERLVAVRGIGRWTAEMFLMFQLGRLDVWPVDDYGVRKGYARAYGLPDLPKPKELAAFGERFRPYRSVAAWYCWRAVETLTPAVAAVKTPKKPRRRS
ncbi:MAG: DNA-3-methyladenine glycosylase [Actinomycetota bacterium]|nr:DNA-3-methyladenine glycosylase 2 family protein [Actinomycetota bacterium]